LDDAPRPAASLRPEEPVPRTGVEPVWLD